MRKVLIYILPLLLFVDLQAQETQFSQFFSASLFLNPGFAGVYNDPTFALNHKRQPLNTEIINEITQVSFVFPIKPKGQLEKPIGGIGIMAFNERNGIDGVFQNNAGFLTYAHNLQFGILSAEVISIGVQAGYELRTVAFSNLSWGSQYNPFFGFDDTFSAPVTEFDERVGAFVLNAGIMYYYNPTRDYLLYDYSAFSGISVTNLNQPNKAFNIETDEVSPMLFKYNGGFELKFNKLFATPSLFFQYLDGNYQFNAGGSISYVPDADLYRAIGRELLIGTWYRYRDSFIFMAGIKVNSFVIRGSYDMNTKLFVPERNIDFAQNSFEISLQYTLSKDQQGLRKSSNPLF